MLKSAHKIPLLALATALVLLAACGGPAAPAPTTTPPPPTALPPTSTRTALPPTITATAGIPAGAYPEIPRVTLEEAKAAYDQKAATFVDVRKPANYDLGHIPGAVNIFFRTIEQHMGELDKAEWIIPYCI
ncbi:MAG TPA: rhodanese-like domain-containing protein [Anaerolineales bacterium]